MAANLYNVTVQNNPSSSSNVQEPDDISRFLQQIILRSSSASPFTRHQSFAALSGHHLLAEDQGPGVSHGPGQISAPDPVSGLEATGFVAAANVSSCSVAKFDSEGDEYDYESEEVVEAVVEETAPKAAPPRSSSKRSRAAEVHNQSEKRRRSRINEKMKALQNLIPNSNKTDKASMLDEAIEYLKQLQLQVQMLTMRNGLSLYPICLPGMLQPNQMSDMRMDMYDTDKFSNVNIAKSISMDQNISDDAVIGLQVDRATCIEKAPVTEFSSMIGSKTAFEVESSMQGQFGNFQSSGPFQEKVLPCRPPNDDCPQTSTTGAKSTSSIPFEMPVSDLKENILEGGLARGDHLLQNFVNNPIFTSPLNM